MTIALAVGVVMAFLSPVAVTADGGTFTDDDNSVFENDIQWMADNGLTTGCNPPANDQFCPDDPVTRGQMAAFMSRSLGLTDGAGDDLFTDDDNSLFEDDIDKLGTAGITAGCNPPDNTEFCPDDTVTRGQMAAFMNRALGLLGGSGSDLFTDDDGSVFEEDIDKLGTAGITLGCNPPTGDQFCPDDPVSRGEMAAFLHRADMEVELQVLAINDFHGNIATTSYSYVGGAEREAVGRADYLAANMRASQVGAANSITVSAGDLVGASPLISALFHDEPTIEAMNLLGLEINGVGNHEFDEGGVELLRLQNGGAHPVDGDVDGDPFLGADFEFLAANVIVTGTGKPLFAPYTVKEYQGIPVAFIGMTLEGTPSIVTPAGVAGLTFVDEVETVNALIPEIRAQGIESIVVLMHQGGLVDAGTDGGDTCGTLSGPLYDIVDGLDDSVDLVIGGHNNQRFVCMDVDGKAVTMAYWSGRMYTDIDVSLNRITKDMTIQAIDNVPNYQADVTPAADLTALIDKYDALSATLANEVIGHIEVDLTEDETAAGESALGDIIADAQLAATSSPTTGNAVAAFMNSGGIRADILFAAGGTEGDGVVTYGEAFTTQPFNNDLVTMTLTGAQIDTLLEQQWVGRDEDDKPEILQVSDGFTYTWDDSMPEGSKIDAATIAIDGTAIVLTDSYRITVNSFLAGGGDEFALLTEGTDRLIGMVDVDALVDYFGVIDPMPPGPQDRITRAS
ncbi:MAG: bifunctional metallophosphatase/5'-nucleotidase [bacterium]|nr:bifunctional metallophosphatase/5'-nucleotidase [bacterium]